MGSFCELIETNAFAPEVSIQLVSPASGEVTTAQLGGEGEVSIQLVSPASGELIKFWKSI